MQNEGTSPLVIRSIRDVRQIINSRQVSPSTMLIVCIALGGVFVDAYDFTSLGVGVIQLKHAFNLSPFAIGSVTATMAFGAFFGALWGGYFTDKLGRYKMFLLDLLFLVIAAIGAALSVNLEMLLFFRFLMGLGVGLDFPVALSFIAEFMPERRKGASINLWQPTWFVAAAATVLIILPFYLGGAGPILWRVAVGFGAVPALVVLLLRFRFMNESALWAAQRFGLNEAARILEKTYGVKVRVEEAVAPLERKTRFAEIFSKRYRLALILSSIICITQSMEYFAVGFNFPSISAQLFGANFLFVILGTAVFNVFGLAGGLTNVAVTQRLGVRRMTIIGYTVVILALLALHVGGQNLGALPSALLIGVFMLGHAFGPGSQGMTMATLSFPTRIRGTGTGWAQSMVRIGSILGFYFFPLMMSAVGFHNMMFLLVVVPLAGLIATIAIRWEPIGQDADEQDAASVVVTEDGNLVAFGAGGDAG